jgi:hypothetical protein
VPGPVIVVENAVCAVKVAALESECADAVRSDSNEVVEYYGGRGVMCSEVVFTEELFLVLLLIFLFETLHPLCVAVTAHIPTKITILMRFIEGVRYEDPR